MNPILLLSLIAFLIPINPRQPSSAIASDIVTATCKKIATGNPQLDYNLCLSLFNSSPGSHEADLKGLAVISINFTKRGAKHVMAVLDDLIEQEPRQSYKKGCLTQCKEQYSDSIADLKDSAKAIVSGRIDDAMASLSAALGVPTDCEDCFSDGMIQSPVAEEDGHYFKVACIPLNIAALLDS